MSEGHPENEGYTNSNANPGSEADQIAKREAAAAAAELDPPAPFEREFDNSGEE